MERGPPPAAGSCCARPSVPDPRTRTRHSAHSCALIAKSAICKKSKTKESDPRSPELTALCIHCVSMILHVPRAVTAPP